MLLKRVQSIVGSRRLEELSRKQDREVKASLTLAAALQRNMLPARVRITDTDFYTCWWNPHDVVSGDLLEAMTLPGGDTLYVLGDIQGHGPGAALSMMAVQSFLKQLPANDNFADATPDSIANLMQRFFTDSIGSLSYMTALICIHRPGKRVVDWISCGAPYLFVLDSDLPSPDEINPEKRGNLPIGMMPDTVYTEADVVRTRLSPGSLCMAFTDGVLDVYQDQDGHTPMEEALFRQLQKELLLEARLKHSIVAAPYKIKLACEACGYSVFADDMTELIFGEPLRQPGVLVKSVPMDAALIDQAAQEIERWSAEQGWDPAIVTKVELVFEEKMMNLFDHGYDIRDRAREQACFRLLKKPRHVELTFWDWGTQEPSILVAAGSSELELELRNRDFSDCGRGRLMVRRICEGIERNRFGTLNETIYRIALEDEADN